MTRSTVDRAELGRCLLCHEPPCSRACPTLDPARILRALRFDNDCGAAGLLPVEDACASCPAPCKGACPAGADIPALLTALRADKPHMEEAPGAAGIDLSADLCGVHMENPFLLSSSVVASTYEMCARAFDLGWAGAAFKTVSLMDIHEASPRFSAVKGGDGRFYGFKNIEQLSDHALEENLEIFTRLKKNYPSKVLIASIMGRDEGEWESLARAVTEAGADVVECNFSCPHMAEHGVGVDVGQVPEAVAAYTAAARRGTDRPLLAKLTPNVADMRPMAEAAIRAGADGIAAINTIKSITGVNLDTLTAAPAVRGQSSVGGYSGRAVKPIALRFIADLAGDAHLSGKHISGMGGIESWKDALEFLLLGAGSLQVTTAVMEYGYRIIDDLLLGLRTYMAQRGIRQVDQLVGTAVENITDTDNLERDTVIFPRFRPEACVGCGRCYISCLDGGHQAIRFDPAERVPKLNGKLCVGCHLCVLVCPRGAISGGGKRIRKRK